MKMNENSMLHYSEEAIRKVINSCMNYEKSICIFAMQEQDIHALIAHLRYERTILFHLGQIRYTFYFAKNEAILYPQYIFGRSEYNKLLLDIQKKTEIIKNEIVRYNSNYIKELKLHDYICQNVSYRDEGDISHSIIGPLIYNCGVCDGIAKTTKLLLQLLGIKAYVITGIAQEQQAGNSEAHAWNIVQIDNSWYHLDVTFDKTISVMKQRYDYFNIPTKEIIKDHTIDPLRPEISSINCVNCDDYYEKSGVYFSTLLSMETYLSYQLAKRTKYLQIRVSDELKESEILKTFNLSLNTIKCGCEYRQSINPSRNIYEWEIDY